MYCLDNVTNDNGHCERSLMAHVDKVRDEEYSLVGQQYGAVSPKHVFPLGQHVGLTVPPFTSHITGASAGHVVAASGHPPRYVDLPSSCCSTRGASLRAFPLVIHALIRTANSKVLELRIAILARGIEYVMVRGEVKSLERRARRRGRRHNLHM